MCWGYIQILCHCIQGTWASEDFGTHGGVLEPIPVGYGEMTVYFVHSYKRSC